MIKPSPIFAELQSENKEFETLDPELRSVLSISDSLFEEPDYRELIDIDNDMRRINILEDQYEICQAIIKELETAPVRTDARFQSYMARMAVEDGEKPIDDKAGTRKDRVVSSAKRLGSSIRKVIEDLISRAVKFLRKLFDLNNMRIQAAEKLKDSLSRRQMTTQTTIRYRGPASYFINTKNKPTIMKVEEIIRALDDADVDIDRLTDELYSMVDEEDEGVVVLGIRTVIQKYFKQKSDVKNSFAVMRPTVNGSAPLRLLFLEKDGKFDIYTETDQNVLSRLKQNDAQWSLHGISKEQAIDLCDGAIQCYNLIKVAERGIPTPSEKSAMIKDAKNLKVATMTVTAAVRTTVAYSRYLGFLANGAVWIAKSYHDNRDNRGSQPV